MLGPTKLSTSGVPFDSEEVWAADQEDGGYCSWNAAAGVVDPVKELEAHGPLSLHGATEEPVEPQAGGDDTLELMTELRDLPVRTLRQAPAAPAEAAAQASMGTRKRAAAVPLAPGLATPASASSREVVAVPSSPLALPASLEAPPAPAGGSPRAVASHATSRPCAGRGPTAHSKEGRSPGEGVATEAMATARPIKELRDDTEIAATREVFGFLLEVVYQEHHPQKVGQVHWLLDKYRGSEVQLLRAALERRIGPVSRRFGGAATAAEGSPEVSAADVAAYDALAQALHGQFGEGPYQAPRWPTKAPELLHTLFQRVWDALQWRMRGGPASAGPAAPAEPTPHDPGRLAQAALAGALHEALPSRRELQVAFGQKFRRLFMEAEAEAQAGPGHPDAAVCRGPTAPAQRLEPGMDSDLASWLSAFE